MPAPFVVVLAPMRSELRPVVKRIGARRVRGSRMETYEGSVGRARVRAARIGVGPEMARRSTERVLAEQRPDHVVVLGIAGGLSGIPVGTLVVPEVVEDIPTRTRYIPTLLGPHAANGVIGTSPVVILDDAPLAELAARGIVGVDMETAAVADVCVAAKVPWSAFRVISDRPEDGLLDTGVFEMLDPDGTVHTGRALRYMVRHPRRLGALARLARDASAAADAAADAALSAVASL
ncbi:MAG: phosphorylase family protein [Acidimicrobiales bacterium]